MDADSQSVHQSQSPGSLPSRIFATDCYPDYAVRINSYSKPKYLIDIWKILQGMPELDRLVASPLGKLFSLHVRQCSLSGQLVHQMLCRQLYTENIDELWFVFGGRPLRFSLQEFADVTGLRCYPLPPENELTATTTHSEGDSPYWYTLLGGTLGSLTIKEIVNRLKSETGMPMWRKFRLCLIVIVEGILLCRNQPVKPSAEVVEMVKDVDFFLNYPWGRHSFTRLLWMVKVGSYLPTPASLLTKLKQSSMAVHGFLLQSSCLHSHMFRCCSNTSLMAEIRPPSLTKLFSFFQSASHSIQQRFSMLKMIPPCS
ncbi:PREDICTED: uncharacterized protein LOC104723739 isoform X1 [Camelina sativa]|uniref:Uncharacterized protein LOC104723739 isoform X1 n=1 Tax=Camelina sativa TaxID=90675 RepID=A0ABM0UFL5_CAMSA|nr:PREDICTED: uncharacterized protein LOC104723739 isoform X1 [Camelina sativa]XP_010440435.1 PREDICTED: uncharacterized protein LOC104723739 isoform X1 [Camelina sativa]XP_019087181.1 PREDICTED: uncharacterized protein LOC104723739 isoform X1 [Camelina sativa]XP_019087182.1 PREDICTED: uncharacterized protein LOC104723739 isoform X1 [Camelina sativa]